MNTWELALYFASRFGIDAIVITFDDQKLSREKKMSEMIGGFGLSPDKTGFLFMNESDRRRPRQNWPARDALIARIADHILPVSVRPKGNLCQLMDSFRNKIIGDFSVSHISRRRSRPRYAIGGVQPNLPPDEFLVHFTRTAAGPWPDETSGRYYQAIVESGNHYPRSARQTLIHIWKSRFIRASSRHIRGGYPMIGFTALSAETLPELMRYRPRLLNPYFEPYGIAISKIRALQLGLRPVRYGPPDLYRTLPESDRPYYQNSGRGSRKWVSEKEWRHIGDFDLDRIPPEEVTIMVPDKVEAELMGKSLDCRVWPLRI